MADPTFIDDASPEASGTQFIDDAGPSKEMFPRPVSDVMRGTQPATPQPPKEEPGFFKSAWNEALSNQAEIDKTRQEQGNLPAIWQTLRMRANEVKDVTKQVGMAVPRLAGEMATLPTKSSRIINQSLDYLEKEHPEAAQYFETFFPMIQPITLAREDERRKGWDPTEASRMANAWVEKNIQKPVENVKPTTSAGKVARAGSDIAAVTAGTLLAPEAAVPYFVSSAGINTTNMAMEQLQGDPDAVPKAWSAGLLTAAANYAGMKYIPGLSGKIGSMVTARISQPAIAAFLNVGIRGSAMGTFMNTMDNAIAKTFYDPNRPWDQGMGQSVIQMLGYEAAGLPEGYQHEKAVRDLREGADIALKINMASATGKGAMADLSPKLVQEGMRGVEFGEKVSDEANNAYSQFRDNFVRIEKGGSNANEEGQIRQNEEQKHRGSNALSEADRQVRQPEGAVQETPEVDRSSSVPPAGRGQEESAEEVTSLPRTNVPRSQNTALSGRVTEEGQWVDRNWDEFASVYADHPDTAGGKILSADAIADLLPSIQENPVQGHGEAVNSGYPSKIVLDQYDRRMAQPISSPEDENVLVMMGNPGSGKTTVARKNASGYGTVIDSPGADQRGLIDIINTALRNGRRADLVMVHAPLEEAVGRNIGRQGEIGRTVPIESQESLEASTHLAFRRAWETFGDPAYGDQVSFTYIENPNDKNAQNAWTGEEAVNQSGEVRRSNSKTNLLDRAIGAYIRAKGERDVSPEAQSIFEQGIEDQVKAHPASVEGRAVSGDRGVASGMAEETPAPGAPASQEVEDIRATQNIPQETLEKARVGTAKMPPPVPTSARKAQAEDLVREIVPDKATRAAIHATGISGKNPTPEDVVSEALIAQPKKSPFEKNAPEAGAIRLPEKINMGKVMTRLGEVLKASAKEPLEAFKNLSNGAVLKLAKAEDAAGKLQHAYDPSKPGVFPGFADSPIEGSQKPFLKKDLQVGKLGQEFRSPSFQLAPYFENGESPSVDREMVSTDAIAKASAATSFVRDVYRRNKIVDDSTMIDQRMSPHQKAIRETLEKLTPLIKQREALVESADMFDEERSRDIVSKRLQEFDRDNQAEMERLLEQKDRLYDAAKKEIQSVAQKSSDARVALWMDSDHHPVWLQGMIQPNEIQAAKEMTSFMEEAKRAGEKRGLAMRDEPYVTHLFKPVEMYARDQNGESARIARDVLDFHRRQEGSINLMPSIHAVMDYYVPTISRKLAMQPFLNKWYTGGKNDYLDPNSKYYAPHFGEWMQREINEMEHPRQLGIVEKGFGVIKDAEITRLLAANQRTAVKHLVGKLTNLVGLHHAYTLPGATNYMALMARRAENLPLVGKAFEATTGKILDATHMSKEDAQLVQTLMSNLALNRQVRNALYENALIAEYQEPILNAYFGKGVRGIAGKAKRGYIWTRNALSQPVAAAEAFENGVNFLSSVQHGEAAGLTPDQNLRGAIVNMLAYSQRGGHDATRFVKSPIGRVGTALTQTPSKMMELYADIVRRGVTGEKDIYGGDGTANLVRAILAFGAVSTLGVLTKNKLSRMLIHPPITNTDWFSDATQWAYHSAMGHKQKALDAKARMQGSNWGPANLTPVTDIMADAYAAMNSPKGFLKKTPAVQQIRSELPKSMGGKIPKGYEDTLHYLTTSPTEEAEKGWQEAARKRGLRKIKADEKQGND